jgi:hypothetical protein
MGQSYWLVVDDVTGRGEENIELFWHLADFPCRQADNAVTLGTPCGEVTLFVLAVPNTTNLRLVRGLDGQRRMGWQSLYYGQRTPAPTVCACLHDRLPARFLTLVSLGQRCLVTERSPTAAIAWQDETGCEGRVELSGEIGQGRAILSVQLGSEKPWRVPRPLPEQ